MHQEIAENRERMAKLEGSRDQFLAIPAGRSPAGGVVFIDETTRRCTRAMSSSATAADRQQRPLTTVLAMLARRRPQAGVLCVRGR